MATALLEPQMVHVEESPTVAAPSSVPSPTTPDTTPAREPSRPVKLVKSLSRHDLDPDLTVRPFPKLPDKSPEPKSPGSEASVRYDSEDGKLKPCNGVDRTAADAAVIPHSLSMDFELAAQRELEACHEEMKETEEPEKSAPPPTKVFALACFT